MSNQTFNATLSQLEDGRVESELNDRLVELVNLMQQQERLVGGKPKGKLVLSLDLKLEAGAFEIVADISTKRPKTPRARSILWATRDGQLTPQNPRQVEMELAPRDIPAPPKTEMRVLG